MRKTMIHRECKAIAYLYKDREYTQAENINCEDFYHIDGSKTEPYEKMQCGSCGRDVRFVLTDNGNIEATNA